MAAHLRKLCLRNISTSGALRDSLSEPLTNSSSHHGTSYLMWRKIFFFVCIPAIGLGIINVSLSDEPPLPEFKKYPHLRIRRKPFPWGDGQRSFFHNPHTNPLPEGYEHQH